MTEVRSIYVGGGGEDGELKTYLNRNYRLGLEWSFEIRRVQTGARDPACSAQPRIWLTSHSLIL
jgi:hypothetical protein